MYSSAYPLPLPGGFRPGVFDTSVLTQDITAALKRGQPSSILAGMQHGTLRGFIPHYVWAEVPRVLADRKREGGSFDLVRAEQLWWQQYVPVLHVVCVNGLPMTPAADKLAHEDLSDVGILQLAGVLAPVVLFASDRDLIRQGVAVPNWEAVRGVLGRIGRAEAGMEGSTATIVAAGYGLAGAARIARAHPVAAAAAVTAAGVYAYRNRSRFSSDTRTKLVRFGAEAFRILGEPFVQHEVHGREWAQARRGTGGDDLLSRVARLLARSPEPMTRTDILAALPASVQEPHRRQMEGLRRLLHRFPAFHQAAPGRWQLGRRNMQITAPPWA
ncbi:PIN domain-containing protein [Streptomyces sp. DSM 41524]|uniref:PIN domain-containing protein n=1 Tax=Streptomyces asiaticus subsp. ignotus TaxID=3098222 RepID=A0ABU7Q7T9_9ACTN|nr:PIN domain-containing protein [Streptomyces sp. DSM 41524]